LATTVTIPAYFFMRRAFIRRLGGMTGDGAGALIEVIEAVSLIALSLYR
jgi:adenosylcobinamide-GDP ribazoletransferase